MKIIALVAFLCCAAQAQIRTNIVVIQKDQSSPFHTYEYKPLIQRKQVVVIHKVQSASSSNYETCSKNHTHSIECFPGSFRIERPR